MRPDPRFETSLVRVHRWALLVGVVGAILCALVAFTLPQQFYPAYLIAFLFWIGLSLGSLALVMLHHLTGGGWGVAIRRILESGASTFPVMAVLFLPIVLGMPVLYIWSHADVVAGDEILQRKAHYLNVTDFLIRAAIYFAIWIGWTLVLNWATMSAEAEVQERRLRPLAIFSGIGLVLWGLSVTFASVDWGMSLEPHWFSSMYGVTYMGGQAVAAFALAAITASLLARYSGSFNILTTARLHDLGNFLLAFVMFWSYVSFMQFLIIWSANLPEETPWYLRRSNGGWEWVVGALMLLHFLLPFLLLLARQNKRHMRPLIAIAALLLVMRLVDLTWQVAPTFTMHLWGAPADVSPAGHGHAASGGSILHLWPLLLTVPAIGGLWLGMFTWRLSVRGLLPVHEFVTHDEEAQHDVVKPAH